ncbi:MAG TPA: TonB-dependent receptor, partial [Candidatus Caenarcaniphilales bacterium]
VQPVGIFDNTAYDASNGLAFNQIGDRPWVPPLTQSNLGLFSQLKWQPLERLVFQGGVRHERVGVDVDDFVTLTGRSIIGGKLDYDATLFNLGAVYDLTDEINVYADFSQSFSVADGGLILRDAPAGLSVTNLNPEAQRVNNYEVGVRGEWDTVQASLAGFYNQSNLGTTFDRASLAVVRAPERVYGLEATVDVQPIQRWRLGSTASFVEGENDVNRDGTYQALNGFRIPPVKLTTYVENETLPGWQNRLQLLYSGNRDRAFNDAIDFRGVESFLTLDLISSLKLGDGTLRLGIQNLLNNQYFSPASQLLRLRTNDSFTAALGRTFSLQYSLQF